MPLKAPSSRRAGNNAMSRIIHWLFVSTALGSGIFIVYTCRHPPVAPPRHLPTLPAPEPTPGVSAPFIKAQPHRPLAMAGYEEDHSESRVPGDHIIQVQAEYLSEKAELLSAIEGCQNKATACLPDIKAFGEMLENVKQIKDELTQIKVINAWINIRILYDNQEARDNEKNDIAHYRTLTQSSQDNMGICKEKSLLKSFALEWLGLDPDDYRWIEEYYYINGTRQSIGHAVTLVRVNNKIWVMDNQGPDVTQGRITLAKAQEFFLMAAEMESAATHLNFSGNSSFAPQDNGRSPSNYFYVPSDEMNAFQLAKYIQSDPLRDLSNVPLAARRAAKEVTSLDASLLRDSPIMEILGAAFSVRYQIQTPQQRTSKTAPVRSRKAANDKVVQSRKNVP